MDRSINFCSKCMVPDCKNTSTKARHKIFVHVNKHLTQSWCQDLNIAFNPRRHYYCCEDHLNLEEDLANYDSWKSKILKVAPSLKTTAKLRHLSTAQDKATTLVQNQRLENELPVLKQLLQNSQPAKRRKTFDYEATASCADIYVNKHQQDVQEHNEDYSCSTLKTILLENDNGIARPTLSSTSHPVKIDIAVQCSVEMVQKGTSMQRPKKKKPSVLDRSLCTKTSQDSSKIK